MTRLGSGETLADYVSARVSLDEVLRHFVWTGVPLAATLVPAVACLAYGLRWRCGLVRARSCFSSRAGCCMRRSDSSFARWATVAAVAGYVLLGFVPLASLVAWATVAALFLDPSLLGVVVGAVALAILAGMYGVLRWRAEAWRLVPAAKAGLGAGVTLMVSALLVVALWVRPYSFHALGAVLLPLSAIPMIYVWYLNAPTGPITFADFAKAKGIVAPGLVDPSSMSSSSESDDSSSSSSSSDSGSGPDLDALGAYTRGYRARLTLIAWAASHATLAALAVLTYRDVEPEVDGFRYLGFARWGAVTFADLLVGLLYWAEMLDSPLAACGVSIWVRALYTASGSKYWLLGDAGVVLSLCIFLAVLFITDRWPKSGALDGSSPTALADTILTQMPKERKLDFELPSQVGSSDVDSDWAAILAAPPTPEPSESSGGLWSSIRGRGSSSGSGSAYEYEYDYEYEEQEQAQNDSDSYIDSDSGGESSYDVVYAYEYTYGSSNDSNSWDDVLEDTTWFRKYVVTRPAMFFVVEALFGGMLYWIDEQPESDVPLERLWGRSQLTYAVTALLVGPFVALLLGAFRAFQRAGYKLTLGTLGLSLLCVGAVLGNGMVFYTVLDSATVLVFHVFVPVILGTWYVILIMWSASDYFFIVPDTPLCSVRNMGMVGGLGFLLCAIVGFGVTVSLTSESLLFGLSAGLAALLPAASYISLKAYFNTLSFTVVVGGGLVGQVAVLGAYVGVVWGVVEDGGDFPLWLLAGVAGYPMCVLLAASVWKWRDTQYVVNLKTRDGRVIVGAFTLSLLAAALFPVGLIVMLDELVAGIAVAVCVLLLFMGIWVASVWVRSGYFLSRKFRWLVGAGVMCAFGGAVYLGVVESKLLGTLLALGVVAVVCATLAGQQYLRQRAKRLLFSEFVFPVYELDAKSGTLVVANHGTGAAFVGLVVVMGTGVGLAFALTRVWIGLTVAAHALLFLVVLTIHLMFIPSLAFGSVAKYVTSGMLKTAMEQARDKELGGVLGSVPMVEGGAAGAASSSGVDYDYAYSYYYSEEQEAADESSGYEYAYEYETSTDAEAGARAGADVESESESEAGGGNSSSWSLALLDADNGTQQRASLAQVLIQVSVLSRTARSRRDHVRVRKLDEIVVERYRDEQRFIVHMQALVLALAKAERTKERDLVRQLVVDRVFRHGYEESLDVWEIEAWESSDWSAFSDEVRGFNVRRKLDAEDQAAKAREDEEAQRKRDEARLVHQRELIRKQKRAGAKAVDPAAAKSAKPVTAKSAKKAAKKAAKKGKEPSGAADGGTVAPVGQGLELVFKPSAAGSIGPSASSVKSKLGSGAKWEDAEFPATEASLFVGTAGVSGKASGWARPEDMYRAKHKAAPTAADIALFGADGIVPGDIKQGALGDCWLLSAISVVAQYPALVQHMFVTTEPDENGVYCVQFWNDGQWVRVLVDDQFPVGSSGAPLYARTGAGDGSELWVMLLEKAYAKLFGSYAALNGGMVHIGLMDMTGGSGTRIGLDTDQAKQDIASGALWARLLEYRKAQYLLGAGSNSGSDTTASEGGIVKGHAYAILNVVEMDGNKLVQLRNPWGRSGEWKGDWSDKSAKWTRRLKAKLDWSDADDGVFWMAFEDFVREFRNLYVCALFPDTWAAVGVVSAWAGESAGGCPNFESVIHNPQFMVTVTVPTPVHISVARDKFSSGVEHIGFGLYKASNGKKRINPRALRAGDRLADVKYSNLRVVSLETSLQPGKYIVIPTTFKPGQESPFSVVIHSEKAVGLAELDA